RGVGVSLHLDTRAAEAILLGEWATNIRGLQRLLTPFACRGKAVKLNLRTLQQKAPELVEHWQRIQKTDHCICSQPPSRRRTLYERAALQRCLEENLGNVSNVARHLGTTRAQVYRWMKRLGIGLGTGG
ncbi:MAG TPA: helix-turn-helix domain-containing protein, partial [Polyangiaceae bacterium]